MRAENNRTKSHATLSSDNWKKMNEEDALRSIHEIMRDHPVAVDFSFPNTKKLNPSTMKWSHYNNNRINLALLWVYRRPLAHTAHAFVMMSTRNGKSARGRTDLASTTHKYQHRKKKHDEKKKNSAIRQREHTENSKKHREKDSTGEGTMKRRKTTHRMKNVWEQVENLE